MRRLLIFVLALALSHTSFTISASHAKENDGDVPLAGISASLQPDPFTGTLTGSIPIEVPPGRNGVQPNLALNYVSSGGNGWLGMGWKLEMGTIERQTKWGVLYGPSTQEDLDGKVYTIRLNGISADLVKLPAPAGSEAYGTKIEGSFLRLKKLTTGGWEVTDTKGTKYTFGKTYRLESGGNIFKWCLEEVRDTDGNFMKVYYTGDQGQGYLDYIDYTGFGAGTGSDAPTNRVKFYLEDTRPDKSTLYTSNFAISTAKRLRSISVWSDLAMTRLVRAYQLTYNQSGSTGSSLLATVQQFGSDAAINASNGVVTGTNALPPITLAAPEANNSFAQPAVWADYAPAYNLSSHSWSADVNGDGRTDLIYLSASPYKYMVMLSNGNGFAPAASWRDYPTGADANSSWSSHWVMDADGDGKADIVYLSVAPNRYMVMKSNGSGFDAPVAWADYVAVYAWAQFWPRDVNGDGRTDLVYLSSTTPRNYMVMLSTGTSFTAPVSWGIYPTGADANNSWTSHWLIDVNGDGRSDIVYLSVAPNRYMVMKSNGSGFDAPVAWADYVAVYAWAQFWPRDVNGDGRTDLVYLSSTTPRNYMVMLSTGTSFTAPVSWGIYPTGADANNSWTSHWLIDVNGDGRSDIVYLSVAPNRYMVMKSTGSNFASPVAWADYVAVNNWSQFWPIDVTGDGNADLVYLSTTPNKFMVMASNSTFDFLVSAINGIGGFTRFTYTPTPQLATTQTSLPFPVHVVTAVASCDNWSSAAGTCLGNNSTTNYLYDGGYFNFQYRDFRGFQHAKVIGPMGPNSEQVAMETWFHQGTGLSNTQDPLSDLQSAQVAYTAGRPYKTTVSDAQPPYTVFSERTTIYRADSENQVPWYTPVSDVSTKVDNALKEMKVTYLYDDYGNVLQEQHYGETLISGDEKTIDRAISNNTTDWLIGFPTRETIYAGLGTAGAKLSESLMSYDGSGSCTTPNGVSIPTKGHLTRVERWLNGGPNPVNGTDYDSYGNIICTVSPSGDPAGTITTIVYDAATKTFPLMVSKPLGAVAITEYYGVNGVEAEFGLYGQVRSVKDANDQIITTKYDKFGRKIEVITPYLDLNGSPSTFTTIMAYLNWGLGVGPNAATHQHLHTINSLNLSSWTFFDGLGRTITKKSTGPGNELIRADTVYDLRGQQWKTTLPYFEATGTPDIRTTSYDAASRVTQVRNADGTTSKLCYSGWETTTIDPKQHWKRQTKDVYGRTVKTEEFTGTQANCGPLSEVSVYATTRYQYDLLGNLLKVTDGSPQQNITTMRYDTLGRKIAMSDPDMGRCGDLTALSPNTTYPWYAAPCWNYQYDVAGNLVRQTDAKNQNLWFRYDALNRRKQKDFNVQKADGAGDVRYLFETSVKTHNQVGRLKQLIDAASNVTFRYDPTGRIVRTDKVVNGATYSTESSYDGLGRLVKVKYPPSLTKVADYFYAGPWLLKVMEGATTYVHYSGYNAMGQAATETYGNGVVTTNVYEPNTFRPESTKTIGSTAPTAPASLIATAFSASRIDLSWAAAMDNTGVTGYRIERCRGSACSNFAEIATTASGTLIYSDIGLTQGNPYTYRVRAVDGSNKLGAYSQPATAIPTDTTSPSAPGSLTAMVVSTTQIDLSWKESVDSSYLMTYRIERCAGSACANFVEIGTATATGYSNSGLSANTTYRYRVRASDHSNNFSAYSTPVTVTTTLPSDASAPTGPGSLTATVASNTQINLGWTASTDNIGVTGYRVERCHGVGCSNFVQIATAATLTFNNTALIQGNSYSYRVRATDAAGNLGAYSPIATGTTTDAISPTVPAGLFAMAQGPGQIAVTWTTSTDASNVIQYQIERCQGAGCSTFSPVTTTVLTSFTDTGLAANMPYSYRVRAIDGASNVSTYSATVSVTTFLAPPPPSTGYGILAYGTGRYGE